MTRRLPVWIGLVCAALACGAPDADLDLESRGERVYRANCVVCHHPDPSREGALGPPVAGSSRELVEARVLRGEYPPGYSPKRDSSVMPPLPALQNDIDALAAFLAAPSGSSANAD